MEPAAKDVVGSYPWLPGWRTGLALIYAELDNGAEARAHFEELAGQDFTDLPRDGNWLGAVALSSLVCSYLRDVRRAGALFDLLSPYADRVVVVHTGCFSLGSASTFLGVLAATLGRFDEAQRAFEKGLRANEYLRAGPMTALTLIQHAAMLTSRNGPGDALRAQELLLKASQLTHDLAMDRSTNVVMGLTQRAQALARAGASPILG
jgi:tetratricopeptide (TPR) repeat protein